jgi:TolB-like protein
MAQERISFGPFVLDLQSGTLTRDRFPIPLGTRGMALLLELLRGRDRVVTKAELMDAAWPGLAVEESNLTVQIAGLRKVLGSAPSGGPWIRTVPRIGYRFDAPDEVDPGTPVVVAKASRPRVAVLPIIAAGEDREEARIAEDLTDGIAAALARFRWFSVVSPLPAIAGASPDDRAQIARELGAGYLLQGRIVRSGERTRIAVQLLDARTGEHLWSDRYEREAAGILAIHDDIAERVAGAIEPELLKIEASLAADPPRGKASAWELVRQGTWRFHQVTRPTHLQAREFFRQACRADPRIWLARVSAGLLAYGWSEAPSADREEGFEAAYAGIRLDPRNPYAHYGLAIVSVYGGELDQGVGAGEKAVELSSSFALGHLVLGMAKLFSGKAAEAIPSLERGLSLHRFDPQSFVWLNLLALARLFSGRAEAALEAALQAVRFRPDWRPSQVTLACCQMVLGQEQDARRSIGKVATMPKPQADALAPLMIHNPDWAERLRQLLVRAGLNEVETPSE